MSKCWNCGLQIADPVHVCPLCKCIVESDTDESVKTVYPYLYAERGFKKMQMALNIYTFAAIAAELILLSVLYAVTGTFGLAIMIGAFLVYGFVTLKVSIQMHTGYQLKMIMQTLLAVAVLILIDVETGYRGWSLNYVLPGAFVLMDLAVIVLMFVNSRNWQSYIPMQLLIIVLTFIPWGLYHFGFVTELPFVIVAMGVSIMTFIGTVIVGGKRARTELYRRFHV